MRFQCTFCFTIIRNDDPSIKNIACPNCNTRIAVPETSFENGCVIDDFVIENVIGHGGMATVYLANQLSMDRPVALKILSEEYANKSKFIESFLKEAQSAARISHPNLIQALKVGNDSGILYYAMEYVKGETLAERLDVEQQLEIDFCLNVVQQCAEALHAAWEDEQLIHRDIKPDNIMLAEDGYAKIMDLGIAITVKEAKTADISGTPTYMAPEQFRKENLDCRTDIYSLGATLYQALIGLTPFEGNTVEEIARKHVFQQLSFPDDTLVHIPQRIKRLITKMMAKEADERFQNYEELLDEVVSIRRRLAPDEDQIPSVHTISFSKYRLYDRMSDSPSEVYRKRNQKKRKVAIAKERQESEEQEKSKTRSANKQNVWLISLLILIILALSIVLIIVNLERKPSPFTLKAQLFMDNKKPVQSLVTVKDIESELDKVVDIKSYFSPKDANQNDRFYYYEIQDYIVQLHQRKIDIQSEKISKQNDENQRLLKKQKEESERIKAEKEKLETDLESTSKDNEEKEKTVATLRKTMQEIIRERQLLQEEKEKYNKLLDALKKQKLNKLGYELQWDIIENCRLNRFTKAMDVARSALQFDELMLDWVKQKTGEISNTEEVFRAVYNSGEALKGKNSSLGKIISIDRESVRTSVTVDLVTTIRESSPNQLTLDDYISLAEHNWTTKTELRIAQIDFAICRGSFQKALELAAGTTKEAYVKELINGCFQIKVNEISNYLALDNKKAAMAKYKVFHSRYGDMNLFKEIKDTGFRELGLNLKYE